MKALEIKTSVVFYLAFTRNSISSCSFLFFLMIDLYFLIPAVIGQIFIVAGEFAISTRIPTKEAKIKFEIHPVTVEAKIRKFSV